jgi:glycosyltransferase involved in cell wall biosynthesis
MVKMVRRIGIDATALPTQPVGAGNYIIQFVKALAKMDLDYEIVVFAQKSKRDLFDIPNDENLHWVIVPDKSPMYRLIWEQTTFPRLVRRAELDLLHSLHYTQPVLLGCPSIVTIHDMTFFLFPDLHTRSKRMFFPFAIRSSVRRADALIAISESTRQDSIRLLGVSPQKIFTTQLGITDEFRVVKDNELLVKVREKYDLPEAFVLYVGLVEPRKNIPFLIRAYKSLVDEGIKHNLVIVGRIGWMSQEVFKQIEELGLEDRVQFTGYMPQDDLPMVYNLASLFVYPTKYEGFGLPALEAMACGTPVVTTAISSLPEIVGDAGMLIPPGDEQALAGAMAEVLSDPSLYNQLRTRGLQRSEHFTWERTAQETLKVYQQVLMGK